MRLLRLFLAITFVVFACARVSAQETAAVHGVVIDANGSPIAGAVVSVLPATHASVVTDAHGNFDIDALPVGTYELTARKAGYITHGVAGVPVRGSPINLTIALQVETLSTLRQIATVSVMAASNFNTSASATTNLTQQNLIDQGQLQIGHALDEIPGVISARPGSSNPAAPGSITSPNLRGALDYEKSTLLDGHPLINGAKGDYPTMLVNSLLFDNIEVVLGPTAYAPEINYGIGGTLNFRTGDPTDTPSGRVIFGGDSDNGSFGSLRFSDTIDNGKLGYLFNFVGYGTQGPLQNQATYVTLPSGAIINGYGKIGSTTSKTPINGATGPYPVAGAANNPANAYTTLVACCQGVTSNLLNKGELAKIQYHFSGSTVFTGAFIGIQSQYDGPASSLLQLDSTFAPAAGYDSTGQPLTAGQQFLLNNKTVLNDQQLRDNEPMFEGELRSTIGNDTVLARFYSAILERQTNSDFGSPDGAYTSGPLTLYGTATIGGVPEVFNGTSANVTLPATSATTAYVDSVEHDLLRGESFQYDHPVGDDMFTFAYDRNTSLTNAYAITPSTTLAGGLNTASIAAGTRQDFNTYLLRGVFGLGDKSQLTLANYYEVYQNTFTPESVDGQFVFASSSDTHDDPRLGFTYRSSPNLNFRFSAGSAIAPPYPALIDNLNTTPSEVTPVAGTITISKNSGSLLPETSFGYDLGADVRAPDGSVWSSDVYLTNIRNQFVAETYDSGSTYDGNEVYVTTNKNLAQSRYAGIESSLIRDPRHGIGYTISGALQRAYAYDVPPGFYTSVAGGVVNPYGTNLGVVPGINYQGFFSGYNGISNKSEAYSQGYIGLHTRGSYGQYLEYGMTYYGSNNTYDLPAFWISSITYRQPLADFSLQVSVDNLFNVDSGDYVYFEPGETNAVLANGGIGIRGVIPYGPPTLRVFLSKSF